MSVIRDAQTVPLRSVGHLRLMENYTHTAMFAEKDLASETLPCLVSTGEECVGRDCHAFFWPGGQSFIVPFLLYYMM